MKFINAVLEDSGFSRISSVEIKNPFNLRSAVYEKDSVLDIKARDEHGKTFNIEVQVAGTEEFSIRSLYYWAKLYSAQLQEGEVYSRLFPVICINLLEFSLFQDIPRYHLGFMLRDFQDPDLILTEHMVIHYLELPKLRGLNMQNSLERWLYYLKNEGKQEEDDNMRILLQDDPDIQKAHAKYQTFTQDDELLEAYEARMKWKRDYNTLIAAAKRDGKQEGHQEGREEERKSMLLQVVQVKFGSISEEISQKLDKIVDPGTIESLLQGLMESESLDEFNARLDKYLT